MPGKGYRLLGRLVEPLRGSQAKSVVAVVCAMLRAGRMRSFAIAAAMAEDRGVRFKSGLQRFYRLVHNPRLDELACWSALAHQLLSGARRRPVVAVDWTEWHSGRRVLGASLGVAGRAIPVLVQVFDKADMPRSQNTRENTFVHLLARLSPLMRQAVWVLDRGFRRVSLLAELNWLAVPYVVRLAVKLRINAPHYQGLLSEHGLKPGGAVDLGWCQLRGDRRVKARVVGIWQQNQDQPWWLATNQTGSVQHIAELYCRRMGIEECFRDTKGTRFGLKLAWTAFTDCQALNRLWLLTALALLVWTLAGALACRNDPSTLLNCKHKGPRRSLVSIGLTAPWAVRRILASSWPRVASLIPPPEPLARFHN